MGHLKLKDGTTFPLTLSVGDIRDISKRSGAFSKTVTLVGDDENNELLNHYYDVNIVAGTFDINKLQACQIIQNGIVILDNAYMQLVEVVKSQTTDAHNQQIEYKVLVKDSVSDFFTKIGNKTLNDININDIVFGTGSLTYTSANVESSFSNTIADGYKYVLPYDEQTNNDYNLRAFHPAIYAKLYFDSIFNAAGFTYEWGNQSPFVHTTNNNYFEKLVIPYNGANPQFDRDDYLVEATKSGLTTSQNNYIWCEQITGFTEVTDAQSIFDPVNGDYAVPFWTANPESIQIQVTINYDVDLINNDYATYPLGIPSPDKYITPRIKAQKQGYVSPLPVGISTADIGSFLAPSINSATTSIASGEVTTVTLNPTNLDTTDILEFFVCNVMKDDAGGTAPNFIYVSTPSGVVLDVDVQVTINSATFEIIPSNTVSYNSDVDLNVYVPRQIKQSDFVKSIFQMYNLYAEVDKSQPNKLILKHRDDYYDSGTEIDWTEKLAKDKDQTLQFLPELSNKKMVLSYKDDDDLPNKTYKEATNETYGQVEYTFENEYVRGIDRKELIFSPTPHTVNDHNAVVPLIGYIPETNIRILIDGGTQTCDSYTIIDYWTSVANGTTTTTAPVLTHFDDPITPTFDINFAVCDYYFYSELSTKTNNNLYNLYWRRTLGQIDKGKMLTAYFDLNEVDIQSLNLNDKIRIDNSWWHINRVIDYDANERKLTKVELISVDEEIEFTPFATTPTVPVRPNLPNNPTPVKPTKPEIVRPVKDIVKKNSYAKNLIVGDVDVKGINNVIQPDVKKAIVIGDGLTVEEDGIHTEKLFINGVETTGNFANTDLSFDANRTHDTQLYSLIISADGATLANEWFSLASRAAYLGFGNNYNRFTNTGLDTFIGGSNRFSVNTTATVINEGGNNYDTRIEGQTDANLFFTDASTNRVGIGTNLPSSKLHIDSSSSNISRFTRTSTTTNVGLEIGGSSTEELGLYDYTNSFYRWKTTKTEFVVNDSAANYDTRIEGQTDANLFFVDASTDRVGIGTNTPSYKLDVNGDVNVPTGSAYYHNATAGLSGTYTFGGGSTGDIATMTFSGGILTAVTTVP